MASEPETYPRDFDLTRFNYACPLEPNQQLFTYDIAEDALSISIYSIEDTPKYSVSFFVCPCT